MSCNIRLKYCEYVGVSTRLLIAFLAANCKDDFLDKGMLKKPSTLIKFEPILPVNVLFILVSVFIAMVPDTPSVKSTDVPFFITDALVVIKGLKIEINPKKCPD